MECFEKLTWNNKHMELPKENVRKKILANWDAVAKPIDGMGRFETLIATIGAILEDEQVSIEKKAILIMCADNGIVEEGVSQSGQEVTRAVAENMGKGMSSVGRMAKQAGADTIPIDIGINTERPIPGVLDRKVCKGTRNFRKEPAMTMEEMFRAIETGIEIVAECKKAGYQLLGTGEMGIGNTTTSSAVAAALLPCEVEEVTGRGAGLTDEKLIHKIEVIREAIETHDLYHASALQILQTVGGLDIAGLVGVCLGGAHYHIPIVLDGVISMVAALLAERIVPGTKAYMIPSHMGKEPAVHRLTEALGIEPAIDGKMALGEGTGAAMMFTLLDMALAIYHESASFTEIRVEQYERYKKS